MGDSKKLSVTLWIVQGLLALRFLFAGGIKLVLPLENLTGAMPSPGPFLRFIGVADALGALGLILPGLLRNSLGLIPLAAAGLVVAMTGATVITLAGGDVAPALIPPVVGIDPRGVRRLCPLAAGAASRESPGLEPSRCVDSSTPSAGYGVRVSVIGPIGTNVGFSPPVLTLTFHVTLKLGPFCWTPTNVPCAHGVAMVPNAGVPSPLSATASTPKLLGLIVSTM